jgi:hypothetical protein
MIAADAAGELLRRAMPSRVMKTQVKNHEMSFKAVQGTLEPVLITPIRREECLVGKALAALIPALAVAYVRTDVTRAP